MIPILHVSLICMYSFFLKPQAALGFDSIQVYDYYFARGATTGDAWSQFEKLEKENFKKRSCDVQPFNLILSRAKIKKHIQQKLGTEQKVFCIAFYKNAPHQVCVCIPSLIIDFTDHKNYWISDEKDKLWLEQWRDVVKR